MNRRKYQNRISAAVLSAMLLMTAGCGAGFSGQKETGHAEETSETDGGLTADDEASEIQNETATADDASETQEEQKETVASAGTFLIGAADGSELVNLLLTDGVEITADSVETEDFLPSLAADGNRDDTESRWSSANEPGNPEHWICFAFAQEETFSFLRITWERLNVEGFVLETSQDGTDWEICYTQTQAPSASEQTILLDVPASGRYLRLRTTAVSESEENQFVYYQNVGIIELEVYAQAPLTYSLSDAVIEELADGSRRLILPEVPDGYEIELAGADYEEIIGSDGTVYSTLEEKTVEIGYIITRTQDGVREETPSYEIRVPASPAAALEALNINGTASGSECPELTVAAAEWMGLDGTLTLTSSLLVTMDTESAALWTDTADAALERMEEETGLGWTLMTSEEEISAVSDGKSGSPAEEESSGDNSDSGSRTSVLSGAGEADSAGNALSIFVRLASSDLGLGNEGYLCAVTADGITIIAQEKQGLIWAFTTLQELITTALAEDNTLSCGILRDYPRYSIRGFSIDIGRRMVSLGMLYQIVDTLALYRMNTLDIHLNDNEILTSSGLTDSTENALTAYSGFRLESSVTNEAGEGLTSEDGYLTKEEWCELVAYGAERGVEVVPEIDMPAHCLSITSLFPETALDFSAEVVDELDVGNAEALEVVTAIWSEYLVGEEACFAGNQTIHIGMDEYYGDAEEFRGFMVSVIELVQLTGHTVRMWGSLGKMSGETVVPYENIQVQIWSWTWAEPLETYQAGYTIINSMSNELYIIPDGGYDRLDLSALEDWEPNRFVSDNETVFLPSFSPRMAGAIYCMWNDNYDSELTEADLYERFAEPLPILAGKLW